MGKVDCMRSQDVTQSRFLAILTHIPIPTKLEGDPLMLDIAF